MSQNKGKDTSIEKLVRSELQRRGYRFNKNVKDLPGKPDIVFPKKKVVVFIDGDFWHGYHFIKWENKLSPLWKKKISETRNRDQRNFRKLRLSGWKVIRIWQHQMKNDFSDCVEKIISSL